MSDIQLEGVFWCTSAGMKSAFELTDYPGTFLLYNISQVKVTGLPHATCGQLEPVETGLLSELVINSSQPIREVLPYHGKSAEGI